jgi:hypothetical protein
LEILPSLRKEILKKTLYPLRLPSPILPIVSAVEVLSKWLIGTMEGNGEGVFNGMP